MLKEGETMGKVKGQAAPSNRKLSKIDRQRATTAYQDLGELAQDVQSWSDDLARFKKCGIELQNKRLLRALLKECRASLNSCIRALS